MTTLALIGERYGRLTVISEAERNRFGQRRFLCLCDCGNEIIAKMGCLRIGYTKSCGCLRKEQARRNTPRTHNLSRSKTYHVWRSMKCRCLNPKNASFANYGGRGITFCDRWSDFSNFVADMGEAPDGLSIERNNNNGNYEPGNCRWATRKEQARNKSTNRRVTRDGITRTLVEWSEVLGICRGTLQTRVTQRYNDSELLAPLRQGGRFRGT